jgi:hypothetical protein
MRPSKYPFLLNLIRSRLFGDVPSLNDSRGEAIDWCSKHCLSTIDALTALKIPAILPEEKYPVIFNRSREVVALCPQQMGGGGNMGLLYSLVRGINATRVIETGVAYGWSSLSILLALRENSPGAQLMSSNLHYPKFDGDEQFVGCAVPEELRGSWSIIRKADKLALPEILAEMPECDLVHYDSAKSYEGRMYAYPLLWNVLKVGGLFVSDDIDDNVGFQHFCKIVKGTPIIVETPQRSGVTKYVGILRKTTATRVAGTQF